MEREGRDGDVGGGGRETGGEGARVKLRGGESDSESERG